MASSHNQVITDAGLEDCLPMIEKGSYVPWPSRFMRYIVGKKDYGKMLKDSIENDLKGDSKKWFKADIDAMNTILLGILNDIHNSVYACQNKTSNVAKGKKAYASNMKFLNSLKLEWDKYVTMVRQVKNLHEVEYDQLYDYLRQNEKNANALRAKRAVRTHDPLALDANHYVAPSSSYTQSPYYVTYSLSVADFHYSTPTNNRLRASSNTRNEVYVQDGRVNVQSKTVEMLVETQAKLMGL
ncbi:hypothetical protein Tco_0504932 [Tanacetum coccineum]